MKTRRHAAFSLVELLAVIGLVAVLMSLLILGNSGDGKKLTTAGNMTVDLINQARQVARTHNTLAMVVMPTEGDGAKKTLSVLSFSVENADWKQIESWRMLPLGVVINDAFTSGFFSSHPSTAPEELKQGEKDVKYVAAVFSPDGRVVTGSSAAQVVQLNMENGSPDNFYKIIVNQATGIPVVRRP